MNSKETKWLMPRTRRMLDCLCGGIDISPLDRDDYNGEIEITLDGMKSKIYLGDCKGVSDDTIDRRFCAAFLSFARAYMGNANFAQKNDMFKIADILLKNYAAA